MSWQNLGRPKNRGGVGYRDLEWFNMTLLAKQGWRLIHNPDGLASKILKEKYYQRDEFLNTPLGRNPSYIWRSIWNARRLIREGMVWRIVNGRTVRIWYDKWAPLPTGGYLQSPESILSRDAKVSELLDYDTNWWNVNLVKEVFSGEEMEAICSVPVCPRAGEDKLVWAHTKNGEYSVKSGYHLAKERFEVDQGSCSNRDRNKSLWRDIWNIRVPNATKIFLWKACADILPTKQKLFHTNVTNDPLCPICQLETETVGHILWHCPSAQDVWMECDRRFHKCSFQSPDFLGIMDQLIARLDADDIPVVVNVARQIWFRRNSVVFGGIFAHPKTVFRTAVEQVEAFSKARETCHKPSQGTHYVSRNLGKAADGVRKAELGCFS
jgi:hypothetical protein